MANPKYVSEDKRRVVTATSREEIEQLEEQGYKKVTAKTSLDREPLNSGREGQRRARASSTTEGSERNSGSTTPSS